MLYLLLCFALFVLTVGIMVSMWVLGRYLLLGLHGKVAWPWSTVVQEAPRKLLYKLTDQQFYTRAHETNKAQWGPGITHTAKGPGTNLCSWDVIHAYEHPVLALLLNPVHSSFNDPVLWEAAGDIVSREGQLKCGVKTLTTRRQIPMPVVTAEQRVEIAIRCALAVSEDSPWTTWARKWLNGTDRTASSAYTAYRIEHNLLRYAASLAADNLARPMSVTLVNICNKVADSIQASVRQNPNLNVVRIINEVLYARV